MENKSKILKKVDKKSGGILMNPVLKEIMRSGYTKSPNRERVKVGDAISLKEGLWLQKIIRGIKATVCIDIGLGYGISSLFICDALKEKSDGYLITIDPKQFSTEKGIGYNNRKKRYGIGLTNLEKAGYKDIVQFYEAPSHIILPKLENEGVKIDFAFIDGWHTFDYTLLDFFYIDRLLRVGGVVAIHDTNRSSIRKVCRFIVTNRSYSVFPYQENKHTSYVSIIHWIIYRIIHFLPKRIRRLFKIKFIEPDEILGLIPCGSVMAFRKETEYKNKSYEHWEF
ncbi:MAG: O-methyltransferase [Candidatus Helarchaeota archaeon]